jgi:glucoamylase
LPEQIWDSPDIPEHGLRFGRPSGSAMPLVWAHAEYVKLRRSLHEGKIFDMPPQAAQRYLVEKTDSPHVFWRFDQPSRVMAVGKVLRLEVLASAVVRWSLDGGQTHQESPTRDTKLGIHLLDLPTDKLPAGSMVKFTFYWPEADRWEGRDFSITLEQDPFDSAIGPPARAGASSGGGVLANGSPANGKRKGQGATETPARETTAR